MGWRGPNALLLLRVVLELLSNVAEGQVFPREALPTQSGYVTVNERSGARMFYAYYEAISPSEPELSGTPILLWLQGGPGCSGMLGNFYELGPWRVAEDLRLHKNSAPWNRLFGVLFLDNPVGTGFSDAPSQQDIPTNQDQIATDVYSALQAFFDANPQFRPRPFYVTGESYAGKYVPSVGLHMLRELDKAKGLPSTDHTAPVKPLRLDGLAIGNGLTHPIVQVQTHASTAYSVGLIDYQQKLYLEKLQNEAVTLVHQEKWQDAHNARSRVLKWLENVTGLATLYDMRRMLPYYTTEKGIDYVTSFLNQQPVKEALKAQLNITWEDCSDAVGDRMGEDVMKSTKWMVEALLGRVPLMLYQGLFDLRDGVVSTEDWINTLLWSGLDDFMASPRNVWKVNNKLAGYVRSHSNLTHVAVAGAGHLVPADQNLHSQVMIESFVRRTPF
eukprot:Gb_32811 [translate_table: standard]